MRSDNPNVALMERAAAAGRFPAEQSRIERAEFDAQHPEPRQPFVPHPDYFFATDREPSNPTQDACRCGGIRHWHAIAPHGCDDCPCTEFVKADG